MFRLAVGQAPAELDDLDDRLDWLRAALIQAKTQGADLLLLPELFGCGYNIGDALRSRAEPLNGRTFDAVSALSKDFGLAIHYGFAELCDGTLFNATACTSPEGRLLSHQRKLAIPPGFEQSYFTPGHGCSVFELGGLRMATLICYDAEFPETVRHVASLGAQLVLVPTALGDGWPSVARKMMPTRAFENGVYLAYANWAGTQNGMTFLGESVIATPDGQDGVQAGSEADILVAEIDTRRVEAAQRRLPYLIDRENLNLSDGG